MSQLENRVALVTGGARGIGRAICERLAKEGAKLAIVDIMQETADKTVAEFRAQGIDAIAIAANVAKYEDAEASIKTVMEKYGRLDILVNCAGITKDNLLMRMSEADWDAVIAVNLKGTYNFTKAAIRPMMKARYGKIVNISSVVGRAGNAGQVNYSASKAGVIGITKSVAKELGSRNIRKPPGRSQEVLPGTDPAEARRQAPGRRQRRGVPLRPGFRLRDRPGDQLLRRLPDVRFCIGTGKTV